MSSSLALSLPLPPRCALPLPPPHLAPKHPSLRANQCHRLVRTLPPPRRLLLAPRASSYAASPAEPAREGGAGGKKAPGVRNRFLDLARLGAVAEGAAEAFFRSEIRRRLAVTAVLIVLSRVGYFVPLPGFDRRLIPDSYLSFAPLPADDLVDFASELKLSFFQLGISHQISASIVMQVLCHVLPSLEKIRKEGLDGHEKIKSYIWWLSLGFAIVAACTVSCYSLQYSIYAASYRVKHVILTSFLLVLGAMSTTWICDTITESGFGSTFISFIFCFSAICCMS
uniref:Preprotein translocase subunit SCY2, chloroplastic n=1 Tax=Triticum urartu TaxID=4572 RepID=A0A8R7R8A8_TRIUA